MTGPAGVTTAPPLAGKKRAPERQGLHSTDLTACSALSGPDECRPSFIAMPGLWSLNFGGGAQSEDPGTLYITAGIGGGPNNDPLESHGLLASIQAAPSPS